ncbi:T6SS effector amidase Tae4 family protein [Pedobacter alluvionis]|uniref:Type VI secretion system (T6SS) effector Tae4 (Amidase) n=1 Tax=Pedobacter alluvionis TaxID=475253 RepID=A0A497Y3L2_9SPHI|nr:T6SS effector amidase Tae4 family protein [Pedobacter alluvionis]RLJ76647.1 type VI secretion system (T6SS) effector Tae4 (amidase) [Pedobacter alluvionis]TFB34074.1 hypothetical protein E3V97_08535 [Pedobacter alluvionis]
MPLSLPAFNDLRTNYPTTSSDLVKATIGGAVNAAYITNTCVVRMSRAFNYLSVDNNIFTLNTPSWKYTTKQAFQAQEKVKVHAIPKRYAFTKKFETIAGADQKRYCFRVSEFFDYLNHKYNKSNHSLILKSGKFFAQSEIRDFTDKISNKTGIICFKTKFSDATGHFTLWDGYKCLYQDYFLDPRTSEIYLWEC